MSVTPVPVVRSWLFVVPLMMLNVTATARAARKKSEGDVDRAKARVRARRAALEALARRHRTEFARLYEEALEVAVAEVRAAREGSRQ